VSKINLKAYKMLKALSCIKVAENKGHKGEAAYDYALDMFQSFHFGLSRLPMADVLDHMDFVCQVERVGQYEPRYSWD
jgi:hypothetical protein